MAALHAGELPEYHGGELGSIFEQKAGECPHHTESLVEHISMVIPRRVWSGIISGLWTVPLESDEIYFQAVIHCRFGV